MKQHDRGTIPGTSIGNPVSVQLDFLPLESDRPVGRAERGHLVQRYPRTVSGKLGRRQAQELHGPPRRAESQSLIEVLGAILVIGADP
jgi:hypothetical protein